MINITEPMIAVWFGNFYRPAFDDTTFVDESMTHLRELGFNTVELDSKDWQDFRDRFAGGEASDFVRMQEHMLDAAGREGLGCMFLSLYLNGDNLYPTIRFSPPVYGESVVNADGSDGRWYRYWSPKARTTMTEHVSQLQEHYGTHQPVVELNGEKRIPICSMWDPIVAPSFDGDGINRYRSWLQKRYGSIAAFNAAYGTKFREFSGLQPEDYCFGLHYGGNVLYDTDDVAKTTPRFTMWADNMRWRADELADFFEDMQKRLHGVDPRLFLMPDLSQWSHFINIDTSAMPDVGFCDLWDTANRGIDMASIAPYVDMCHWFTLPVTMSGDPDAYAVSCQHAHMRALNHGRDWLGGVYWGRFLYNDIYRFVTPEETVGSIVAAGARGISAYGWCGLDDGGILHRMDDGFMGSLSRGNRWAKQVIPLTGKRRQGRVAILFPAEMALCEPLAVKGAADRRADLLGAYRFCCDHGCAPDIVEKADLLHDDFNYNVLIVPADDCYHTDRDMAFEAALRRFADNGGTVVHSAGAEAAELAFDIRKEPVQDSDYRYQGEGGLLSRENTYALTGGKPVAEWCEGGTCVMRTSVGNGRVYSFGFMPGYQYIAKKAPHVPQRQRNNELYPFTHMKHNVLADILRESDACDMPLSMQDVECAPFENGYIIVNHRSVPVRLPESFVNAIGTQAVNGLLPAHSSAFIPART